ncbi:MAG: flippase-like domain-containing protein [Verrucomicrobiae bacterium]|nr:flippase-like domain-containing protein [Verrucomicrobiae bacterium]NNJ42612.1 flippase-like domain-containing protein [Akkermansiaceae bacterium]
MSAPAKNHGHRIAVLVSGLLSLTILLVLAVRLDGSALLSELGRLHWGYLPLLVLITLSTFWVRALRWRHLLPDGAGLSRMRLFEATLVGFTATFILPLRVGEVIRPWVLSRWQPVKFSAGLASVVTERAFDALTLLAMLGLALAELDSVPPLVAAGAKIVTLLAVAILIVMIAAYLGAHHMIRVGERMIMAVLGKRYPKLAQRMVAMVEDFLAGLRGVSSLKDLVWSVFWSLVLWALLVALYQIGLVSFGVNAPLWVGVTVCVMIALAVAAPGAPGFVGTFQLGCVVALAIFDFPEEFGVAYSIVLHALQAVTVVVCGFVILHRRGLHLSDLSQRATEKKETS